MNVEERLREAILYFIMEYGLSARTREDLDYLVQSEWEAAEENF